MSQRRFGVALVLSPSPSLVGAELAQLLAAVQARARLCHCNPFTAFSENIQLFVRCDFSAVRLGGGHATRACAELPLQHLKCATT